MGLQCLTLLPRKVQVIHKLATLARRSKHAICRRRKRRERNLAVNIEQRFTSARRPLDDGDFVLLVVFGLDGAGEG